MCHRERVRERERERERERSLFKAQPTSTVVSRQKVSTRAHMCTASVDGRLFPEWTEAVVAFFKCLQASVIRVLFTAQTAHEDRHWQPPERRQPFPLQLIPINTTSPLVPREGRHCHLSNFTPSQEHVLSVPHVHDHRAINSEKARATVAAWKMA